MHPKEMELMIGKNPMYERISILEDLKKIRDTTTYLKIWMWRVYI